MLRTHDESIQAREQEKVAIVVTEKTENVLFCRWIFLISRVIVTDKERRMIGSRSLQFLSALYIQSNGRKVVRSTNEKVKSLNVIFYIFNAETASLNDSLNSARCPQ